MCVSMTFGGPGAAATHGDSNQPRRAYLPRLQKAVLWDDRHLQVCARKPAGQHLAVGVQQHSQRLQRVPELQQHVTAQRGEACSAHWSCIRSSAAGAAAVAAARLEPCGSAAAVVVVAACCCASLGRQRKHGHHRRTVRQLLGAWAACRGQQVSQRHRCKRAHCYAELTGRHRHTDRVLKRASNHNLCICTSAAAAAVAVGVWRPRRHAARLLRQHAAAHSHAAWRHRNVQLKRVGDVVGRAGGVQVQGAVDARKPATTAAQQGVGHQAVVLHQQ